MPVYIETEDKTDPYFPGEGTQNRPFLISTAEQLAKLAELVNSGNSYYRNKHYKMIDDIDLSGYNASNTSFNNGKGWIPIGYSYSCSFIGRFDGGGHTITGLYINNTNGDAAGLFGYVYNGTVENLGLVGVNIIANSSDTGGVAGYVNNYSTVQNCYVTGNIDGNGKSNIGGVVGSLNRSTVKNCYSAAAVINGYNYVGGVAGRASITTTVQGCYSTGTVSGSYNVGGIAGIIDSSTVKDCAALNDKVSALVVLGRVAGYVGENVTFSGNVGFEWILDRGENKLYDGDDPTGPHGATRSAEDLQLIENFPEAFHNDPWTLTNGSLPGLFGKTVEMPAHILAKLSNRFSGDGTTPQTAYRISSASQLATLAELVNSDDEAIREEYNDKYYLLTADIDLSDYGKNYREGKGWIPIGKDGSTPFRGDFEGGGHTITGLYINDETLNYAGLFGCIENDGSVQNLGLEDVNITGQDYVGGLVGCYRGTTTDDNRKIENCYAIGVVSGNDNVGGLVGYSQSGKIENCYTTSTVNGNDYVGGLVGFIYEIGVIKNCYTTGNASGRCYVGGIIGIDQTDSLSGEISHCYSAAVVNGADYVGGIAGFISINGKLKNCIALNPLINAPDTSDINIGRIAGVSNGNLAFNYSFSRMKVNGQTMANGARDDINGENVNIEQVFDPNFWTNAEFWGEIWDKTVWIIEKGKLPILANLPGQSDDGGLYLTPQNIAWADVEVKTTGDLTYKGKEIMPELEVIFDGKELVESKDYTVSIINADKEGNSDGIKVGKVELQLTGIGNYTGTTSTEFYIKEAELKVTGGIVRAKTYDGTTGAVITEVTFDGL